MLKMDLGRTWAQFGKGLGRSGAVFGRSRATFALFFVAFSMMFFPHHPRGDGSVFNRWVVRARACVCVCVRACVPSALSAIYSCGNFSKVDFKIAWRRRPKEIVRGDSRLKGNMYYDDFPQTRRRYTNFPNKGNYIGSDFPGQPKTLFART